MDGWISRLIHSFIMADDIFEKQMIKIPLNSENDHPSYQSIYMTDRFLKKPRLKIRRVV